MANHYSWKDERGDDSYHLPGPDHLGWWAAAAVLVSLLLHVAVFFALDRMKIALRFQQARELSTGPVDVRQVQIAPETPEIREKPENLVVPPVDPSSLLEEIDLLDLLPKDVDVDISTQIVTPEFALEMPQPALAGDPDALAVDFASGLDVDTELLQMGQEATELPPAAVGQLTIDPGAAMADDPEFAKFTDELMKQGADGKAREGALDGLTSLDDLIGLPPNTLVNKTTMLPSDLLFEFNRAELRESAKLGLMKLGLLMDRNPTLYCWIEGHTDTIGGDSYNLELSKRRAEAVKHYLVDALRMDEKQIMTRGFGRTRPIVADGDADAQSPNRRVEIRMRRTPPKDDEPRAATPRREPQPVEPVPPRPNIVEEPQPPVLIQPRRALPVDEYEIAPPPVARPVDEIPAAPRARPVEEPIPNKDP